MSSMECTAAARRVEGHFLLHRGHVILGDKRIQAAIEGRQHVALEGLALVLRDGLGDEVLVGLVAHRDDVAALFAAEQVARAADLEVAHGDAEACAEGRRNPPAP
jgi:hypothetical protein